MGRMITHFEAVLRLNRLSVYSFKKKKKKKQGISSFLTLASLALNLN